jgi:hypothetical protein
MDCGRTNEEIANTLIFLAIKLRESDLVIDNRNINPRIYSGRGDQYESKPLGGVNAGPSEENRIIASFIVRSNTQALGFIVG